MAGPLGAVGAWRLESVASEAGGEHYIWYTRRARLVGSMRNHGRLSVEHGTAKRVVRNAGKDAGHRSANGHIPGVATFIVAQMTKITCRVPIIGQNPPPGG